MEKLWQLEDEYNDVSLFDEMEEDIQDNSMRMEKRSIASIFDPDDDFNDEPILSFDNSEHEDNDDDNKKILTAVNVEPYPNNEDKNNSLELDDDSSAIFSLEDILGASKSQAIPKQPISKKSMIEILGFTKAPFGDSLDTSFFYKSHSHASALTSMMVTIEQDISFGLIYGQSGTGKTFLSQAIVENLDMEKYLPVLIPVVPGFSRSAFLKKLLEGFGCNTTTIKKDINSLLNELEIRILNATKAGIKPLIIIDECHFMSSQALHMLRALTNFEAFNKKLITCLLFAEPNFMRRLQNPYYASLRSRIYFEIQLLSLNEQECTDYIKYRLMVAGNLKADFFNAQEIQKIFKQSKGLPRNINKEALKLMMDKYFKKNKE